MTAIMRVSLARATSTDTVQAPSPPLGVPLSHSTCGPVVVGSDEECVPSDEAGQ
jgi:hypothetical protein